MISRTERDSRLALIYKYLTAFSEMTVTVSVRDVPCTLRCLAFATVYSGGGEWSTARLRVFLCNAGTELDDEALLQLRSKWDKVLGSDYDIVVGIRCNYFSLVFTTGFTCFCKLKLYWFLY